MNIQRHSPIFGTHPLHRLKKQREAVRDSTGEELALFLRRVLDVRDMSFR